MSSIRQSSFARGEITDDLYGRVDQQLYAISVHTARNFMPGRFGQIDNRPGSQFLGQVKTSSAGQIRLIPFIFNQSQSYALEFGNLYIRIWKSGAQVTETAKTITALTLASPGVVTSNGHGFANGDELLLAITGIPQLNGRNVVVANVTANTFTAQDNITLANISTVGFTAFTSGTAARIYSVTTPYMTSDLPTLNFVQSADVLSIAHSNYAPADLSRLADASWTLTTVNFKPGIDGPSNIAFPTASGSASTMTYQVTSVAANSLEESLPGLGTPQNVETYTLTASGSVVSIKVTGHGLVNGNTVVVAATNPSKSVTRVVSDAVNPLVWTSNGHGYANGDSVYITGVISAFGIDGTAISNKNYVIANVTANTFELTGVSEVGAHFDYSGVVGTTTQPYMATYANQTWVITKTDADNFTLNGAVTALTLTVTVTPHATVTANSVTHALSGAPSASAPNVLTWSAVSGAFQYNVYVLVNGIYEYIGTSSTLTFSDTGLTAVVNHNPPIPGNPFSSPGSYPAVVGYFQQRRIYASTSSAVAKAWFSVPGCYTNFTTHSPPSPKDSMTFTLSSTEVNAIRGMADLRKLVMFTLGGEWSVEGLAGSSISAVDGVDARQSSYNGSAAIRPLIVNSNGLYVQAQSSMVRDIIWNFQSDNFTGEERSIYSNHLVQGYTITDWAYQKVPYSTVFAVRSDGGLLSYTYLREQEVFGWARHDFIGSATGTAGNMTTSAAVVENVCAIPEGTETAVYLSIKRTINGTVVRYVERFQSRLVNSLLDCAYMDARLSYDGRTGSTTTNKVTGLWHLVGQSVSVIADGIVIANPLDATYAALTVAADGSLTLPVTAQVIHVGLPFVSDLETHDPEIMESETMMNKRMAINSVTLFLKKSLGGWIGRGGPPADTSQSGLSKVTIVDSDSNAPAAGATFTGKVTTPIEASFNNNGRILVRQIDPLPMTILSLAINGNFPTRQKGT